MGQPEDFYDDLASQYHLLFADWWLAALEHGEVVARLLTDRGLAPADSRLLDCTCGIGTQALPLALLGYAVTATDISARAVERARVEAERRNIRLDLTVADIRRVAETVSGPFDAAISCDNALPHLLTDVDLDQAIRSVRACLREGGVFLASIRDYDALAEARPSGVPISLHGDPGTRYGTGQAWTWTKEGDRMTINLFVLTETDGGWNTSERETTYRALRRDTLTAALRTNGFATVEWLMPERSGYYQPVVLAVAEGTPSTGLPGAPSGNSAVTVKRPSAHRTTT
jgi:SAM-dependent methyltransferase